MPYDGKVTIPAFVEAAGKDSGKLLHARLQQDLTYWKAVGPTLTPNWLDQLTEPGASLFVKFDETELLISRVGSGALRSGSTNRSRVARFLGFAAAVIRSEMGRARSPQWRSRS